MQQAISASRIFTGQDFVENHVLVLEEGRVVQMMPRDRYHGRTLDYEGHLIVPAFIDLQVYGAAGRLLAVFPEASTLRQMYNEFSGSGTALFLPTAATNTMEVFRQCIDAVREYWKSDGKGVAGLHLEGPWINRSKKGAHVPEWIHAPSEPELAELLDYGRGVVRMITLAPEVCSSELVAGIAKQGILVSAGHSNASYEQAMQSFDNGVTAVTHLYNAMSPLQHRAPGLVGASFEHARVMASIIPDGYHADYAAVRIAKKIMGERLFAITDAVTQTDTGPYRHQPAGEKYECNGVLSGSALTMHKAFLNLVRHAGIEPGEALRMCSLYPARLLGMDATYGLIAPGAAAAFLVLDAELEIADIIL